MNLNGGFIRMYMNLDQYNSFRVKVLNDLYNKKVPEIKEYLSKDFSGDDFTDLIKEMESDGLINNVQYVHGTPGHDHVVPSFEHVAITNRGIAVLE